MHECKGLGACLLISTIKLVVRYYNAHIYNVYSKQEPRGPKSFVYKEVSICACAVAKQTGIPLEFSLFGRSFDVLSSIWSEFDEICFLLKGGTRLLGHALLLGHIRYRLYVSYNREKKKQYHGDNHHKYSFLGVRAGSSSSIYYSFMHSFVSLFLNNVSKKKNI